MKSDTGAPGRANSAGTDPRLAAALARLAAACGVDPAQAGPTIGPAAPVSPTAPRTSKAPARPAQGPKGARRRAACAAALARRQAHRDHVRSLGAAGYDPTDIPSSVRAGMRAMHRSPYRAEELVAELPRTLALRVRRCALAIERQGARWVRGRTWASVKARTVAALAWGLWRLSRTSRRGGFCRVAEGVSVAMLGAQFEQLDGCRGYSASWLWATHAGRRADQRGPLTELRDAGVFLVTQPPATVCPRHAGPPRKGKDGVFRRYAFNQYRFTADVLDARVPAFSVYEDAAIAEACVGALPRRGAEPTPPTA